MKMTAFFGLILCSIVTMVFCHVDYTGHKIYRFYANDESKMDFLKQLSEDDQVDVWKFPTDINEKMVIRIAPDYMKRLENDLKSNGIVFYEVHDNIEKLIDEERKENPLDDISVEIQNDFSLNVYHSFEAISAYLDSIANRYNDITNVVILGTTHEDNLLKGLKIGKFGTNKPAIWIDAGIHAREWIAPATALYIIDQFVKGYSTNKDIQQLLDNFDWYIFPVMNPDGYMYTWMHNRLWLKNRSPLSSYPLLSDLLMMMMDAVITTDTLCRGVNLNGNFDTPFGGSVSSYHPCSNNYQGTSAFSEAESITIRNGVLELGSNLKAYLSLHSFAQEWMPPYISIEKMSQDYEDQMKALEKVNETISKVHGMNYIYRSIGNKIRIPQSGSSVDWAYDIANVKYSFTVQLRYTDDGFIIPNSQIIPIAEENFAGIKELAKFIHSEL